MSLFTFLWLFAFSLLLLLKPYNCRRLGKRVIGGDDVPEGAGQFVVQLIDSHNQTICSGSIVSPRYVLTARHCVNSTSFVVISRSITRCTSFGVRLKLQRHKRLPIVGALVYGDYQANSVHRNDIALLQLSTSVSPKRVVQLEMDYDYGVSSKDGENCNQTVHFYGYGQTFEGDQVHTEFWKRRLQVMSTRLVNGCNCTVWHNCSRYSDQRVDDFLITNAAADDDGNDGQRRTAFFADSGGPLIGPGGRQIGIATGLGVLQRRSNGRLAKYDNYFVKVANHGRFLRRFLDKVD